MLNYVCLPGIGVGDSCWEKRGGVRGGLAKGGQRDGEEGAGEEEEAGSQCPPLVIAASGEQAANCSLSIW